MILIHLLKHVVEWVPRGTITRQNQYQNAILLNAHLFLDTRITQAHADWKLAVLPLKGTHGVYLNITSLHLSLEHSPVLCSRRLASLLFHPHSESLHLLFSLPLQTLSATWFFIPSAPSSLCSNVFSASLPSPPYFQLHPHLLHSFHPCPKSLPPYNVLCILLYFYHLSSAPNRKLNIGRTFNLFCSLMSL